MSRAANDWAWSLDIKPASLKLLLLAMADRADEDHCCFPSIPRLEKDTGLNRKTILSGIKKLVECGVLKDTGEKRGRTMRVIVYKLVGVETGIKKLDARTVKTAPVEMEPISEQCQNWNDSENGTLNSPENGTLNRPENGTQNQSLEPVIEPIKDLVPSELETDKPAEPVLFRIPLNRKDTYHEVTQSDVNDLIFIYPAVDVMQQLREITHWNQIHPARRKTKNGIQSHIQRWLSKEQDRGRVAPASQATSAPDEVQKLKAKIRQLEIDINSENAALLRFQSHKNHASEIAVSSCQRKLNEMLQQREALLAELSRA
ncbi:TPA: helix-turn-helix domain-containing protein [Vibrio cholerae]|nr:helix-turn-helix domain-containing protein [Vibrio cholerae]HCJ6930364.1 helix-turn-helix domain-containing protein [Vibrio cholerae]HCJ6934659.1 helix-turn-helix domain-containing protein [Vibrio cholerae]HCK0081902.1 helix-turn-helix domain-containing protein [Vibrio cholerae]